MIGSEAHATFRRLIDAAGSFVLATHLNPDGDAVGSEVSLARFLHSRGKALRIVNHDPTPPNLQFVVPPELSLELYRPAEHDAVFAGADLVVLLDNSAPDRLGAMERVIRAAAARVLCIDHHPAREMPWPHRIVDERACATTVIVYELTRAAGFTPDRAAAQALYVGLATDTGFFRFKSTSAHAHEIAAELLRLGADPARTFQELCERNSLAYTRLLGHSLAEVELTGGGVIAVVRIDRGVLERTSASDVDTSEISTALLAMDGVRLAILFRELDAERVKVSLRSKGGIDVHRLAGEFGGGGHRNASGIVMSGTLDGAAREVLARARRLVEAEGSG
jgi:phosphoesterase RecJ-like protein